MKYLLIAITGFLYFNCSCLYAQQAQNDQYSRNSATLMLATHRDYLDDDLISAFKQASMGDKFDYNTLTDYTLKVDYSRSMPPTSSQEGITIEERKDRIANAIKTRDLGKEIIAFWFNRNAETGIMDMNRIHQRGEYDVTDADVIQSQSIKRGDAALMEAGYSLINNSFVIVSDYDKLQYASDETGYYWTGNVSAYVFQVDFTDEAQQEIYTNCWVEENDSDSTIARKKAAFDRLTIPVKYITHTTRTETYYLREYDSASNTREGALNVFVTKTLAGVLFNLEKEVDQLKVRASVFDTRPIRAKIGKKEGLRNGSRYFTYEYRLDANNNIGRKKTGVIRAESVVDNRQKASGDTETSEFYQIAGRRIQPGMLLEQHNDLGLGVFAGYKSGAIEGININADLLIPALWKEFYVGVDGSFFWKKSKVNNFNTKDSSYSTYAANLHFGKGFHFARSFELRLYVLGGFDYITNNEKESSSDEENESNNWAYIAGAGAKLIINIYYPVQLVAGAEVNTLFGEDDQYKISRKKIEADRSGVSFYGGLRICF